MTDQIQVKIIRLANGKQKAGYRSMLASGEWNTAWHHMTVKDATAAIKSGVAHVGACPNCRVVPA